MPATSKTIEIPEQNPIRWVVEEQTVYTGKQTPLPYEWFKTQIRNWQIQQNYYQKFTFWDYIGIQIFLAGAYLYDVSKTKLQILDCDGNIIVDNISRSSQGQIPGNTVSLDGVQYPFRTINFQTSFANHGILKEGVYFLRLKLAYSIDGDFYYDYRISEPIEVREEHPYTVILEYISFKNKMNTHFMNPDMFFHLRIEGTITINATKTYITSYKDQKMNPRLQNAIPYKELICKFGYPTGLPMYMLDKANRAFCNDYVLADKTRVVRLDENEIEKRQIDPRFPLFGGSLLLKEYDEEANTRQTTKVPLTLYTIPFTGTRRRRYLMKNLIMKNNASGVTRDIFTGWEINTEQEEDEFINVINGVYIPGLGLKGYVTRIDNKICYINGEGESYDTSLSKIWTKAIWMYFTKSNKFTGVPPQIKTGITISGSEYAFSPGVSNSQIYCIGNGTGSITHTFNYDYYNNGNPNQVNVKIWHNDTITDFLVNSWSLNILFPTTWPFFEVAWPSNLGNFGLTQTALQEVDLIGLNPAVVHGISMRYNPDLTSVLNMGGKNWVALSIIFLNNNKFSTATVDGLFIAHQASTPVIPSNGVFHIHNQNPVAGVTAASLTERNKLVSQSWSVSF